MIVHYIYLSKLYIYIYIHPDTSIFIYVCDILERLKNIHIHIHYVRRTTWFGLPVWLNWRPMAWWTTPRKCAARFNYSDLFRLATRRSGVFNCTQSRPIHISIYIYIHILYMYIYIFIYIYIYIYIYIHIYIYNGWEFRTHILCVRRCRWWWWW